MGDPDIILQAGRSKAHPLCQTLERKTNIGKMK